MTLDTLFQLIFVVVFLIIYLSLTQKIYNNNKLHILLLFGLLFPCMVIIFNFNQPAENLFKIISSGCIFLIYYLLLVIIKKHHQIFLPFLVRKNLINNKYIGKDFTFTLWDGNGSFLNYRKERALNESTRVDKFITYFLLFFPLISAKGIYFLLHSFSSK